jgi:peptidyl-prolyl cis-trans isomerase A (cyclophilin A)
MAWVATIDEQDLPLTGGGYQDAPFNLATTFRLAPGAGQKALGLLTASDNDVYSLGVLPVGSYTFTVALGTWYSGAGFGGASLPTLGLFSSAGGAPIAQSSAAGTLNHQIDAPGTFFVGVLGTPGAPASQYALNYERVAPPPNQAARASTSISGTPVPGNVLSLTGSLSDGNGTASASLSFQWTSGGQVVGSGNTYTVRTEDVGRAIDVLVSFIDDAGYLETFSPAALTGRLASAPKLVFDPTLTVAVAPQVRLQTTLGDLVMELQPARAPASVSNLLAYVEDGYYGGTLFHRVVSGFVVQGGGYTPGLVYKEPSYDPIPLESANGLSNVRGSVAMARTSQPDSATSQFYVNLVDNRASLDAAGSQPPGYAVFGTVVSGMQVVDALAGVPTSSSVPRTDVLITAATQTVAGLAQGRTATLPLTDLEPGGAWQYSLDAGKSWAAGSGSSLVVPEGRYGLGDILVRQTDAAGNPSAGTNRFATELVVAESSELQPLVRVYAWKSHAMLAGVVLESAGQPTVVTGTDGAKLQNGDIDPTIDIAATLPVAQAQQPALDAAVTLRDAVSILKMVANQPVNPSGRALSPYQALAADFDGNGAVSLADALGVLRHAVGLPAATAPRWAFVDEADAGMPARATTSPGLVPATLAGVTPVDGHVGLVGVLRGDVDGSWQAPAGTPQLEADYFTGLVDGLAAQHPAAGFALSQWGVYTG